nr:hypothetical protein [Pectobacterium polaris]
MRLDIVQLGRNNTSTVTRGANHRFLGVYVGLGNCGGTTILIGGAATDYCQHRIAITQRGLQRFEDHYTDPFAAHIAVCRCRKAVTAIT